MDIIAHLFDSEVRTATLIFLILLATLVVAAIVGRAFNRGISRIELRGHEDTTGLRFARRCVLALIYGLGGAWALVQVPELRIMGHSMLAGAGLLTIVAGLASQQVLSNIVSGVLIVIFRPFRLNDRISVNGLTGTVEDITLRDIVLRDLENNRVVIPNAVIMSNSLTNFNHTDMRVKKRIDVGIGYDSDLDRAIACMVELVSSHPLRVDGRSPAEKQRGDAEVLARVTSLGDSAVIVSSWFWAANVADAYVVESDLLRSVKLRFDAEGIAIPYAQRTLSLAPGTSEAIAHALHRQNPTHGDGAR